MNAPENINSLRQEIAQHLASTGEATAKQIAEAILQEKVEVARALNDMHKSAEVEREKKRGNEYVYWLSAAAAAPKKADAGIPASESLPTKTYPPETLRAMIADLEAEKDGEPSFLAPEDYEMPPADPALLAMANRELSEQLEARDNELFIQAKVVVDLRERIAQMDEQISSLTADVTQTRTALNHAINEADRLRRELTGAVDVADAAVGYLVKAPKRKPRYITKPEGAQAAALAAVRAGAARADVLALVPVGTARRGAEWQGIQPLAKGD